MNRLFAAVFFVAFAAAAQDNDAAQPSENHQAEEAIVVTATRGARKQSQVPASVSVVHKEDVEATPSQSLDDVLRTSPSVDMPVSASYQQHPTANSISMRGLGGIRTLVLLDGIPLNHPALGYVQWSRVAMEDVDRIEIVRGGGSSLWGNYALGGVINVITKAPDKNEALFDVGAGRYGTERADAYGAAVVNEHLSLNANLSYFNTDGYNRVPQATRTNLDVPTAFDARNLSTTARFIADPTLTGFVRANYHDNHQTLGTLLSTNHEETWDVAAGVTKDFGGAGQLVGSAFHTHSFFQTSNPTDVPGTPSRTDEFVQNAHTTPVNDYGASLQWTGKLNELLPMVSVGADLHYIDGEDDAAIFDSSKIQLRTDIGRGKQVLAGIFGQASLVPVQSVEILGSVRYERWTNLDGFDGNPGGLGQLPDKNEDAFSPRLSVRWQLAKPFALRAAGYSAFRAPNFDNLYRGFSTSSGIFLPNAQLEPERLYGGEAGFDVKTGSFRAQVTGFVQRIDNLITSRSLSDDELPRGFFFGTRNINAGRSVSMGVEAEGDYAFGGGIYAGAGWTYTRAHITDDPEDPGAVGNQVASVPLNRFFGQLRYETLSGFRVSTRLRYLTKTYGDNDHTLPQDAHFVADASVSVPVRQNIEAYFNVENLFNNSYVADNSGFGPPQLGTPVTVFAGVRVRIQ